MHCSMFTDDHKEMTMWWLLRIVSCSEQLHTLPLPHRFIYVLCAFYFNGCLFISWHALTSVPWGSYHCAGHSLVSGSAIVIKLSSLAGLHYSFFNTINSGILSNMRIFSCSRIYVFKWILDGIIFMLQYMLCLQLLKKMQLGTFSKQ